MGMDGQVFEAMLRVHYHLGFECKVSQERAQPQNRAVGEFDIGTLIEIERYSETNACTQVPCLPTGLIKQVMRCILLINLLSPYEAHEAHIKSVIFYCYNLQHLNNFTQTSSSFTIPPC